MAALVAPVARAPVEHPSPAVFRRPVAAPALAVSAKVALPPAVRVRAAQQPVVPARAAQQPAVRVRVASALAVRVLAAPQPIPIWCFGTCLTTPPARRYSTLQEMVVTAH